MDADGTTNSHPAPRPRTRTRPPRALIIGGVLAAVALVAVGYLLGARSSVVTHHPRTLEGVAVRVPSDVAGFAQFRADDAAGPSAWIPMNLVDVVWRSGDRTGVGFPAPPCLPARSSRARVEIGVMEVARPFGSGSYEKVLSLTCLPD